MRRRLAPAALVALLALSAPGHVTADAGAAEARFYFGLATRDYANGRYASATERFLTAYRASPNPRVLFNVAMAAFRAGQRPLAFTSFEEYLASDDDHAEHRERARAHRDALRAELALVRVTTEPEGAALYVERRERGIAARSPALLPLLEDGEVRILAERDGHRPAEGTVSVSVGQTAELELRLEARTGRLVVDVDPPGAEVFVGRVGTADRDPFDGGRALPIGRYRVRATAPGHRPRSVEVRVTERAPATATLRLEALPRPTGRLLVDGDPPGATVEVDGRVVGTTPVAVSVPVGLHDVRVDRFDFLRRVEVVEERPTYLIARPASAPRTRRLPP